MWEGCVLEVVLTTPLLGECTHALGVFGVMSGLGICSNASLWRMHGLDGLSYSDFVLAVKIDATMDALLPPSDNMGQT
eukprot:COSAG01_NODE_683_length_14253_cov_33.540837_5_plen_78_part_00